MPHRPRRKFTLLMGYEAIAEGPDGWSAVPCAGCREPLRFHQPDDELPGRMIATCPECRRWYLVECAAKGARALLVELPDTHTLRGLRRLPPTG